MEIKLNDICSQNLINVNITFCKNEVTSLIGSNLSSKIELINLINVEEKIISGEIKYGRKKIEKNSNNKKIKEIRKDIYYLKEDYKNMLFNINIKEDIKFYLENYSEEKLYELLKSFNLDNSILTKNYLELSDSKIKIILLIIGLMSNSKILLLCNPTKGLDSNNIQTLIKKIKKLKREDKVIVISSYNTNFLLEISDKILVLDDKKIIQTGNKYEILSNEILLKKINLNVPNVIQFINKVKSNKNIKIGYRDNINDLIKDIYRYAK